jgi:hypothetical protein
MCIVRLTALNIYQHHQPRICKVMGSHLNPGSFAECSEHFIPAMKVKAKEMELGVDLTYYLLLTNIFRHL